MQITLSNEEAGILRETLTIYLADLRREIVHTDSHDFRDELRARERLLERLLAELGRTAA